ncbi:MAG: hypothetical protein HY762_02760 [Planctomycetes bacterium]|nr:hypothetical protein [Planctomycetota bacterium]
MMKRLALVGLICAMLFMAFACRGKTAPQVKKESPKPIAKGLVSGPNLASRYQPPDVPVLANFAYMPQNSVVYINGNVRTAIIKYVGSARTEDIINFYKIQLPKNGWMEQISSASKQVMLFRKGREKCQIDINQSASGGLETYLTVKICYYGIDLP